MVKLTSKSPEIRNTIEISEIHHKQTSRIINCTDEEFENFRIKKWVALEDYKKLEEEIKYLKKNTNGWINIADKFLTELNQLKSKIKELEE